MSLIAYLIVLVFIGLVVGALARLALPGRDPMTIPQTIAVGLAGSFIAGLIGALLLGRGAGWLLSIICSAAIVYFIRRSRGGGLMDPGVPPE
jgi:uncharacterized membrane protein YeaQ/YmgE (transglycosylase-associated protein family)